MADRFNLRVLHLPTTADVAREVARIEGAPDRVAAAAPKGTLLVIRADHLAPAAAVILKQELLALDADCVISPAVYLGERDTATDTLIMATERQYRALIPRLRPFPLGDLPRLAEELEVLLASYTGDTPPTRIGGTTFRWGERTYVMGILNVTPDSFSGDGLLDRDGKPDAGRQSPIAAAVEQARDFLAAGADILDVGGESTRPGAPPIPAADELARVIPVIAAVRAALPAPISIDTFKADVAAAALDAGADLVNDVWGLRQPGGGWNEPLAELVATRNVPIVLMHNRRADPVSSSLGGHYQAVEYTDLLGEIMRDLRESIAFAMARGIRRERIIVDPGIGFGKTPSQNVELLRQLSQLRSLGLPILLGTSRKSFIGRALNLGPQERAEGTAATVALGIQSGADLVRVHDVATIVRVARMADVIVRPGAWERALARVDAA